MSGVYIIYIGIRYTVGRCRRKTVTMEHGAILYPKVSQLFTIFIYYLFFFIPSCGNHPPMMVGKRKSLISIAK